MRFTALNASPTIELLELLRELAADTLGREIDPQERVADVTAELKARREQRAGSWVAGFVQR